MMLCTTGTAHRIEFARCVTYILRIRPSWVATLLAPNPLAAQPLEA